MRAEIHHKYIHDPQELLDFDGKNVDREHPYNGKQTLGEWVKRAQIYARNGNGRNISEKQGVAIIAEHNPHVIDVEMGLNANPGAIDQGQRVADRMDIVALEEDGIALKIVFYEAKVFSNSALRAANHQPRVLEQLKRYERWIAGEGRSEQICSAYHRACGLLLELNVMRDSEPKKDALIMRAAEKKSALSVDPKPRLVVFGYTAGQVDENSPWVQNGHKQALQEALLHNGYTLLMEKCAKDVRLEVKP